MKSLRQCDKWSCFAGLLACFVLAGSEVRADSLYSITDLGTLSGQSSSVATGIDNNGQVVGISYNSSDGNFDNYLSGPEGPPRFQQIGNGAQSFLYINGALTQINPAGGLATSINNLGQVVGGSNSSINDSGQYVTGGFVGIITGNTALPAQIISGGVASSVPLLPLAINNSGEVAGLIATDGYIHAATYQDGKLTDLNTLIPPGSDTQFSHAIAINQNGDVLVNIIPTPTQSATVQSVLFHGLTGETTPLSALPGGSGMLAAALNNHDQVVGNGFLYSNGSIQSLLSLLPASSGWSNLNATGINDAGQIVGQGTYNGQELAFLMTPDSNEVPEPGTLAVWGLIASCAGLRAATRRRNPGN